MEADACLCKGERWQGEEEDSRNGIVNVWNGLVQLTRLALVPVASFGQRRMVGCV